MREEVEEGGVPARAVDCLLRACEKGIYSKCLSHLLSYLSFLHPNTFLLKISTSFLSSLYLSDLVACQCASTKGVSLHILPSPLTPHFSPIANDVPLVTLPR